MFLATCINEECNYTFLVPSADLELKCPRCGDDVAITGICGKGGCQND